MEAGANFQSCFSALRCLAGVGESVLSLPTERARNSIRLLCFCQTLSMLSLGCLLSTALAPQETEEIPGEEDERCLGQ